MDSLSEYVLIDMFKNLDVKSILNCSEVCRSWNEIIMSTSLIVKKLKLVIGKKDLNDRYPNEHDSTIKYFIRKLARQYQHILLSQSVLNYNISSFLVNQTHVRKLEIFDCDISQAAFYCLIKGLSQLEELKINETYTTKNDHKVDVSRIRMPNLKLLHIEQSRFDFLQYIGTTSIKYLHLDASEYFGDIEEYLGNFLLLQHEIKNLFVFYGDEFIKEVMQNYPLMSYQFQLNHLDIRFFNELDIISTRNVIHFLQIHQSTLKNLVFHVTTGLDYDEVLLYVIRNMYLEILDLDYFIPIESTLFDDLNMPKNLHLKKLTIKRRRISSLHMMEKFLVIYQNLQELKFFGTTHSRILEFIFKKLPNLKQLELGRIKSATISSDKLEILHINRLGKELILRAKNLKKLIIGEYRMHGSAIVNLHAPGLQSLIINTKSLKVSLEFIKALKENCPKLKTFKIYRSKHTFLESLSEQDVIDRNFLHVEKNFLHKSFDEKNNCININFI
ncbi:hypothetical protein PVAND_009610 [Polypedilum vanderplanki]|uniref:F-box domain-containing protein n=1 Tax=Polypedilum vanderplanki TaxID=319348 RepID=A0A9J6CE82_POLVA|nr:hypothetical protein PVAND_009610 [Polypedilum vanderplanki]